MVSMALLTKNHLVSVLVPLWVGYYYSLHSHRSGSVPLYVPSMISGKFNPIYDMWMIIIISTAQGYVCVCNGIMYARQLVHSLSQFMLALLSFSCSFVCWAIIFLFHLLPTGKPSIWIHFKIRYLQIFFF